MSRFEEVAVIARPLATPSTFAGARADLTQATEVLQSPDVTIFNWTATDTTLTPTRVDTGTAGSATGNITFNATDSVAAQNMQTAIRALGGIYADATVVAGATADNMIITVYGGYDITWAKTGGTGTITESGAAGSDTATPGGTRYRKTIAADDRRFVIAKKLVTKGTKDKSVDISIVDKDSKNVFVATGIDTSSAEVVKLITAAGVAGEDGAAAANTSGGLFRGGLVMSMTLSAPVEGRLDLAGVANAGFRGMGLFLTVEKNSAYVPKILERTTGARTTLTGQLTLGVPIGNIKRIKLENGGPGTPDTSVAPTVTDADGLVVYTKTSTDYTTPVLEQLSHEGFNQANGAVADLLDVVAKSPLTISGSGLGSGTFKITVWVVG